MPFERGRSGNPAGGPAGSRYRQQLNGEFIAALLRDFRQGGPKAIERVRRTQPAAYLKTLASADASRPQGRATQCGGEPDG